MLVLCMTYEKREGGEEGTAALLRAACPSAGAQVMLVMCMTISWSSGEAGAVTISWSSGNAGAVHDL